MGVTRINTSQFIHVDEDLDLGNNKAINAEDAGNDKDVVTKEQLDDTAESILSELEWKGLQW